MRALASRERLDQTVVAAFNPVHLGLRGRSGAGKLLDHGQHREVVGIGQEETADRVGDRVLLSRGVLVPKPLSHRVRGDLG
jgi:hypothetical protein